MRKPTTWSKFSIRTSLHKNYLHTLNYHYVKYNDYLQTIRTKNTTSHVL